MSNYEKLNILGRGKYGEVFRIKDKRDNNYYALKISKISEYGTNILEYNVLFTLEHPNIIKGINFTSRLNPLTSYIQMELADLTLEDYILLNHNIDADNLIYEFLSAINFLHKNGFVHCDIKPDNILIKNNRLKLADLGLTSLKYLSPNPCLIYLFSPPEFILYSLDEDVDDYDKLEDFIINNNYDFLSAESLDIWAVGMIIYYILQKRYLISRNNFILKYIDYIKDYKNNLKYNLSSSNMKYYDMLLKCLEPNPHLRATNIKDVFISSPIYSAGIRDDLIKGITKYNYPYFEIKDFDIKSDDLDYFIKYKISLVTYFGFLDLFYRAISILTDESTKDLFIYCFLMACKIYDINLFYDKFEEIKFVNYNILEFKILQSLNGRIIYDNFYTYAFSLQSLIKIFNYTTNSKLYLTTDYEQFMSTLALMETDEELKNRKSKKTKFKEYMDYID
ncbi:MAG: protein kinase [Candidatus Micrarchaeaceae archaeon]